MEQSASPTQDPLPLVLEYGGEDTILLKTPENLELWRRIVAHTFDPPDATITFESRLATEQGWTIAYARRTIEEYRRYTFFMPSTANRSHRHQSSTKCGTCT